MKMSQKENREERLSEKYRNGITEIAKRFCIPKTGDSSFDGLVHEIDDLLPDRLFRLIKIVQTRQFAVSHVRRILVIVNGAGCVKIISSVRYCRITEVECIRCRTAGTHCDFVIAGHVVEHHVDVNSHIGVVTSANHIFELIRCTRSRTPDVGYRLIALPPWSVVYNHVLLYRRNLQQFTGILIIRSYCEDRCIAFFFLCLCKKLIS